jgi:hypothetical protein
LGEIWLDVGGEPGRSSRRCYFSANLSSSKNFGFALNLREVFFPRRRSGTRQHLDLGDEARETVIEGWTQSIKEWSRIDWLEATGRANAPRGF